MPKSIMIVDDSDMTRNKLRDLFNSNGWVVLAEAIDGVDALDKARNLHLDFVVVDFCMPNMDGLETAQKLKNLCPTTSIVMLTAFKNTILEEEAYKAGISWVIPKTEAIKVLDFARILLRPDGPKNTSSFEPRAILCH